MWSIWKTIDEGKVNFQDLNLTDVRELDLKEQRCYLVPLLIANVNSYVWLVFDTW